MQLPQIKLIPLYAAVNGDRPSNLDVLLRITPPLPTTKLNRPNLNLSIVIDASSSMQGEKIALARRVACFAVQQLLPTDRLSIIVFDRIPHTLVNSSLVSDKAEIISKIEQIETEYGTALHTAWQAGALQVLKHVHPQQLNRVILISDGINNLGETNSQTIVKDIEGILKQQISTTSIGLGDVYDQRLLINMACQGQGNYYYLESLSKLTDIFKREFQDLLPIYGSEVSLEIEPQSGVKLGSILTKLSIDNFGNLLLPNLIPGNPLEIILQLQTPTLSEPTELCYFRLAWQESTQQQRQKLLKTLYLPVINSNYLPEFPPHPQVLQKIALLKTIGTNKTNKEVNC